MYNNYKILLVGIRKKNTSGKKRKKVNKKKSNFFLESQYFNYSDTLFNPFEYLIEETNEGVFLVEDESKLAQMWNNEILNHELNSELNLVNFDSLLLESDKKIELNFELPNNQLIFNMHETNLRGKIKNHILFFGSCFDFLNFQQVFRKFSDQKIILVKETITNVDEELCLKNNFIILKCRLNNIEDLNNCAIEDSFYVFCLFESDQDFTNKILLKIFEENFKKLNYTM